MWKPLSAEAVPRGFASHSIVLTFFLSPSEKLPAMVRSTDHRGRRLTPITGEPSRRLSLRRAPHVTPHRAWLTPDQPPRDAPARIRGEALPHRSHDHDHSHHAQHHHTD